MSASGAAGTRDGEPDPVDDDRIAEAHPLERAQLARLGAIRNKMVGIGSRLSMLTRWLEATFPTDAPILTTTRAGSAGNGSVQRYAEAARTAWDASALVREALDPNLEIDMAERLPVAADRVDALREALAATARTERVALTERDLAKRVSFVNVWGQGTSWPDPQAAWFAQRLASDALWLRGQADRIAHARDGEGSERGRRSANAGYVARHRAERRAGLRRVSVRVHEADIDALRILGFLDGEADPASLSGALEEFHAMAMALANASMQAGGDEAAAVRAFEVWEQRLRELMRVSAPRSRSQPEGGHPSDDADGTDDEEAES